jgi:hypothetical protein
VPLLPLLRHQNTRFTPVELFSKQSLEEVFSETLGFRDGGCSRKSEVGPWVPVVVAYTYLIVLA